MDKLQGFADKPINEFINILVNTQHYKPLPLVVQEAMLESKLSDKERELLSSIYFKSDIYTHDLVYNKYKLATEYKTSTRTIERRIAALTEAGWLDHDVNALKEPVIRFSVPKELRQSMLAKVPRRTSGDQDKPNRNYIKAKTGEKIFATYKNNNGSECLVWLEEGRAHLDFAELKKMLERLMNHIITNGASSNVTNEALFVGDNTTMETYTEETTCAAQVVQQEDTSEIDALESELNGKLSCAEKELSMLSFLYNRTDFLAKANEVHSIKTELAAVKKGRDEQTKIAACGKLAEKPVRTPATATKLSQEHDKIVATPYINILENKNEQPPCKKAPDKKKNNCVDNSDLIRFSATLKKTKSSGYHTKETTVIPQPLKDKVKKEVQRLYQAKLVSNAEMLNSELLFAIERQFVGKPKDKGNPSFYDVMRFNVDVALRLVREGRWQSPTGIKEKQQFTVEKKVQKTVFRNDAPQTMALIAQGIL